MVVAPGLVWRRGTPLQGVRLPALLIQPDIVDVMEEPGAKGDVAAEPVPGPECPVPGFLADAFGGSGATAESKSEVEGRAETRAGQIDERLHVWRVGARWHVLRLCEPPFTIRNSVLSATRRKPLASGPASEATDLQVTFRHLF